MKRTVKVGISFGLIWIILNMILFYTGVSREAFEIGILLNVFFLLCAIAVGLYLHKKDKEFQHDPFPNDFKAAMQSGIIYTILVCAFIYLYHSTIDPSIRNGLAEQWRIANEQNVPDEEAFLKLQEDSPNWEDKSYNDYIENQEDIIASTFSTFSVFIFHLAGLFFFSIFYAFFTTLVMRKVVLRQ